MDNKAIIFYWNDTLYIRKQLKLIFLAGKGIEKGWFASRKKGTKKRKKTMKNDDEKMKEKASYMLEEMIIYTMWFHSLILVLK